MSESTRAEKAIADTLRFYSEVEKRVRKEVTADFSARDVAAQAEYKAALDKGIEGGPMAKILVQPEQLVNSDLFFETIDQEVETESYLVCCSILNIISWDRSTMERVD